MSVKNLTLSFIILISFLGHAKVLIRCPDFPFGIIDNDMSKMSDLDGFWPTTAGPEQYVCKKKIRYMDNMKFIGNTSIHPESVSSLYTQLFSKLNDDDYGYLIGIKSFTKTKNIFPNNNMTILEEGAKNILSKFKLDKYNFQINHLLSTTKTSFNLEAGLKITDPIIKAGNHNEGTGIWLRLRDKARFKKLIKLIPYYVVDFDAISDTFQTWITYYTEFYYSPSVEFLMDVIINKNNKKDENYKIKFTRLGPGTKSFDAIKTISGPENHFRDYATPKMPLGHYQIEVLSPSQCSGVVEENYIINDFDQEIKMSIECKDFSLEYLTKNQKADGESEGKIKINYLGTEELPEDFSLEDLWSNEEVNYKLKIKKGEIKYSKNNTDSYDYDQIASFNVYDILFHKNSLLLDYRSFNCKEIHESDLSKNEDKLILFKDENGEEKKIIEISINLICEQKYDVHISHTLWSNGKIKGTLNTIFKEVSFGNIKSPNENNYNLPQGNYPYPRWRGEGDPIIGQSMDYMTGTPIQYPYTKYFGDEYSLDAWVNENPGAPEWHYTRYKELLEKTPNSQKQQSWLYLGPRPTLSSKEFISELNQHTDCKINVKKSLNIRGTVADNLVQKDAYGKLKKNQIYLSYHIDGKCLVPDAPFEIYVPINPFIITPTGDKYSQQAEFSRIPEKALKSIYLGGEFYYTVQYKIKGKLVQQLKVVGIPVY